MRVPNGMTSPEEEGLVLEEGDDDEETDSLRLLVGVVVVVSGMFVCLFVCV